MAIFETEEERRAREAQEARAAFFSRRDLLAPPPESPAPAPAPAPREGPYGDSPAAQLFRRKTAQIAPSAPMATGFERNPVKFNNELNRPAPPRRDLLALPASPREEAPALRAPRVPDSPRDLLRLPDQDADLDREIDRRRREIVDWKPSFFGGMIGQYDRKRYDAAREGLQQLEEQRAHRQRRAAGSGPEKPFEVDGALGFRNPDGTLRWERPPAREKEAKPPEPPKVVDRYDDREGNRILVWQDHTGKKWEEKAQFQGPKPRDPDADYNRRETDRDERDRKREEARVERENANRTAEQKAQAQRDASRAWLSIDEDAERYPTHAAREAAKRKAASYFGVSYPPGEAQAPAQPQGAPARGQVPAPIASHGPAAAAPSGGGGPIRFVRDPQSGALVRAR